jgi:riboflavin kinase / FMN adenylyltransferase
LDADADAMRILRDAAELGRPEKGVCIALGMFDGVHLGHQHVVRHSILDACAHGALSVAVTFHPHPLSIVQPARAPHLLQSLPQRLRALGTLGVDAVLAIPFTAELAAVDGATFIRSLASGLGRLRSVTVGQGFHFGHQRSGNVALLRSLGRELGFITHAAAPIHVGAERVSSTRIRHALREGRLAAVAELLGRPYALSGPVVHGRELGRKLGFPTANIDVTGLEVPPHGVYAARVHVHGRCHPSVLNLGVRPTVDAVPSPPQLEVHLLDFAGDLYGAELEVEFVRQVRPERRFPSVDALRAQIMDDVKTARDILE